MKLSDSDLPSEIADESETSAQNIVVHSQIVGLLMFFLPPWMMPIAAGGIELMNKVANKRMYERVRDMKDTMHSRLNDVDRSKVDKGWFQSEEYQTMLFEAVRQVTTTADRKKIAMLGNALANSGTTDFQNEHRKELFLQLIRDITPQHIAMLRRFMPDQSSGYNPQWQWNARPMITSGQAKQDELAVLQMLAASGVLTESVTIPRLRTPRFSSTFSDSQARQIISEFIKDLQRSPEREFRLSEFGRDFLKFVSMSAIPDNHAEVRATQNDQPS
jgi:hypothetical protein